MDREMKTKTENTVIDTEKLTGGKAKAAMILFSIAILLLSFIDLFLSWSVEQSLFQSSTTLPDIRIYVHGLISLFLFVGLWIAYAVAKTPRLKQIFHVWFMAAILNLALVPVRLLFITNQQQVAAFEILTFAIFASILIFIHQRHPVAFLAEKNLKGGVWGIYVMLGGLALIPWVLWGALGSLDDTLLYLVEGAFWGLLFVEIIYPSLFQYTQTPAREISRGDFFLDGWAVLLFMVLTTNAVALNGIQPLMLIVLTAAAWLLTSMAILGRGDAQKSRIGIGALSGLLLVLPLLWYDADELSLVIGSAPGEVIEWAFRSAWTSMGVMLFFVILAVAYVKVADKIRLNIKMNLIFTGVAVAVVAAIYFLWGQPGFFGDKVFIVMKQQADLSQVNQIQNVDERRAAVYQLLVQTADSSQQDLRQQLDRWHASYTPYYLVNAIEVEAGPYRTMILQHRSDVDRILQSPELRPLHSTVPVTNTDEVNQPVTPTWNMKMIKVDEVHDELAVTGKGIVIGQTDSGVDGYHPEVKDTYRGRDGSGDYDWLDPWNHSIYPTDAGGHGTATLALITGKNLGVAPDAQWIGCVNLARNLGNPAKYLNCMQFMLAPYPQSGDAFTDGVPAKGANIVNNSWGCPEVEGCDARVFSNAVAAMEDAGIFMSVAAGNTGDYGCSTVSDPPSIYADVFTAGSIDQNGNVSSFSSLGPVKVDGSDRVKPDILAPGEAVVSAFPGKQYTQADGTSFSAPQVSGVVALMWSANPNLIGNVELTKQILEETATPYSGTLKNCGTDTGTPNDTAGYGILNAYAAVLAAKEVK
jgi:subtilisin family serine protease